MPLSIRYRENPLTTALRTGYPAVMTRSAFAAIFTLIFAVASQAVAITPQETEFFEKQIRPVLVDQCYSCHSAATQAKGKLLLDSRQGLRIGASLRW